MTDELNKTKVTKKNDEDEPVESDIEQDDDGYIDDKNSVTTDDEFYNELMDAPAELEDLLIPDECKDEVTGIEQMATCLNRRYNASPVIYTGTLENAVKEALMTKEIKERRPLLIYVNHDKSLYSNVFCKQLLCHDKIIDFLLNNYVLWAWDVTFPSNGQMLNEICQKTFTKSNAYHLLGTLLTEQYPMLIGVYHDRMGDFLFNRLIDGSNKIPVVDEFLGRLIQLKEQFDLNEEDFERTKKTEAHAPRNNFHRVDPYDPPRYHFNRGLEQMSSMNFGIHPMEHSRFPRTHGQHLFSYPHMTLPNAFMQLNINPDDSDNNDDDDDDDNDVGQTPTVDHPLPEFPK